MSYKRLGDHIIEKVEFNDGNKYKLLQGVSNNKYFQKAKTNIIGIDLAKYRVAHHNQFVFNRATTRNGDKISIALRKGESCIVSPSYRIFEVRDENLLHPDYLQMWFTRPEFDRYARFKSHGSAHEFFDMEEMCEVELPIPSIEEQRQIVAQYQSIANKIKVNEQICEKLEATAQALYKHWFVDNKSDDWEMKKIGEVSEIKAGGDRPTVYSEIETEKCFVPIFSNGVTNEGLYGFTDKAIYPEKSITISARGTIGYCVLRNKPFVGIVRLLVVTPFNKFESTYLFEFLKRIEFDNSGSVQNQLTIPQISTLEIIMPPEETLRKYDESVMKLNNLIEMKMQENKKLTQLQSLLLSRLAVGEEEKRKIMV